MRVGGVTLELAADEVRKPETRTRAVSSKHARAADDRGEQYRQARTEGLDTEGRPYRAAVPVSGRGLVVCPVHW